jgi:hypothetical protein
MPSSGDEAQVTDHIPNLLWVCRLLFGSSTLPPFELADVRVRELEDLRGDQEVIPAQPTSRSAHTGPAIGQALKLHGMLDITGATTRGPNHRLDTTDLDTMDRLSVGVRITHQAPPSNLVPITWVFRLCCGGPDM